MLFVGYRVKHAAKPGEAAVPVGVIARILPRPDANGRSVAVTWPTGDTTWHRAEHLMRVGSARENELHPETRAGYPPPPDEPEPLVLIEGGDLDPMTRLEAYGRATLGHVTIHADYGPLASRTPDPDWTCQLVWATGEPEQPTLSFYGFGTTLVFAVAHVLAQIDERLAQLAAEADEEEV